MDDNIGLGVVQAAVLLIGGLVGYGKLRGDVAALRRDVDNKAGRELVEANQSAILRELSSIQKQLSELRESP